MTKTFQHISRRGFLRRAATGVAAGALAAAFAPARAARAARVGLHDKVRLAVIGAGSMGPRHLEALAVNDQCAVIAVCDATMSRFHNAIKMVEDHGGGKPDGYQDFRHVLDRKDIDAILVATPDHWHPLLTILGCQAGKDVYVEKPVCTTIEEGRAMVEAARRYGRVVQAGTQQRSMEIFQRAIGLIHSGRIGRVTSAGAWVGINGLIVEETPSPVPRGLDWDLWLGPAPWVPYSPERFGGFMGWHDYARGGELSNWGVHLIDVVHWGIGQDQPLSVQALGGTYRTGTGADNYETIEAMLEYPGCNVTWEQRLQNRHAGKGYGIRFNGTDGALYVDRNTFVVEPAGLGIPEYIGEPERSWAHPPHHNNFFDCVRTRKRPAADIEQAFRSTAAVLLAGIALKTRRRLNWDGAAERFINDEEANRHLTRAYRPPWHL